MPIGVDAKTNLKDYRRRIRRLIFINNPIKIKKWQTQEYRPRIYHNPYVISTSNGINLNVISGLQLLTPQYWKRYVENMVQKHTTISSNG